MVPPTYRIRPTARSARIGAAGEGQRRVSVRASAARRRTESARAPGSRSAARNPVCRARVRCAVWDDGLYERCNSSCTVPHRAPGLRPRRRDLRVRDPRRRRQGQGPQGRRASGDRLRRRRARLPDARLHRRGRGRGLPQPEVPPLHAGRRSARAEGRDRREDAARLRLRGRRRRRSWSPTAASRPSTRRSPRSSTRATRSSSRRRTGPPTRSRSGWPAVSRSRSSPTRRPATASPSSSWRRPAPSAPRSLLFVSPSNPTGAVYTARQVEAIGRWAVEHGLWVLTDEIYEHLVYGDAEFTSLPAVVPELRDKCIVVNGVAKTYAMTGWRVGWIIGPKDVVKAATNLQSHATSNVSQRRAGRRARRRLRRPGRRRRDARGLRPPPPDHRADAQRDRRRALPGARGRVLRVPVGEGAARQGDPRQAPADHASSWPR